MTATFDTDLDTKWINPATYPPPLTPRIPTVRVGDPATIILYTDTRAAVVTKVSPQSIVIARVETGESRQDMASDAGAYGVRPTLADGQLDKIIDGSEQRYRWNAKRQGFYNMGTRVVLGRSVTRVDHRF